jgi:hypothetical protein
LDGVPGGVDGRRGQSFWGRKDPVRGSTL